MKMDLLKASRKLSELDLKVTSDNLLLEILWFRVMSMGADQVINRNTHSTYEFHFIASGSFTVVLDTGSFEAGAGEFYVTAPGVHHEQRSSGHSRNVEYCINCNIQLIEDKPSEACQVLQLLRDTPCACFKDTAGILKLFEMALQEAYHQYIGFYSNIQGLAAMIVMNTARVLGQNNPLRYDIPLKTKKDNFRFVQIEKFVEDNIGSPLSTKDIARFMFLSERQVCRIVEESRGISTKDFIMQMKLAKARQLLKDTGLSVKQIADSLGFSSEYYFNQFFKREEGYPPGLFRHNVRKV